MSDMETRRYFVAVAARDAVDAAIAGGYVEINHGKAGPLERMRDGDGIAYYSPRTAADGEALQAFTALGYVCGNALYQAGGAAAGDDASARAAEVDASARPGVDDASARPFRRAARYEPAQPAPIRPMIDSLAFIRSKSHWGAPLRFGFLQVSVADFACIAGAMGCATHGATGCAQEAPCRTTQDAVG